MKERNAKTNVNVKPANSAEKYSKQVEQINGFVLSLANATPSKIATVKNTKTGHETAVQNFRKKHYHTDMAVISMNLSKNLPLTKTVDVTFAELNLT